MTNCETIYHQNTAMDLGKYAAVQRVNDRSANVFVYISLSH